VAHCRNKNVCSYICRIILCLYVQKRSSTGAHATLPQKEKLRVHTIDFIHAVLDPVSLSTTLTPSVTRLGSGLKGCMLSDTWNYQICKYLAPYSSTSCQRTGDYSSKFVFVCLFMNCLPTLPVIRVMLCRFVGLVMSEVLAKKAL